MDVIEIVFRMHCDPICEYHLPESLLAKVRFHAWREQCDRWCCHMGSRLNYAHCYTAGMTTGSIYFPFVVVPRSGVGFDVYIPVAR